MSLPSRRALTRFALLLGACLVVLAIVSIGGDAFARVGGGQTYGGGGGGGGSSGGGGDGIPIDLLIWLLIEHPQIGVPVVIGVVIFKVVQSKSSKGDSYGAADITTVERSPARRARARSGITAIRNQDPAFSRFVFHDFVHLLYIRWQESRGAEPEGILKAWLTPEIRASAASDPVKKVERVVVGSLEVRSLSVGGGFDRATVFVEANVDESTAGGAPQRLFVRQLLHLQRKTGIQSTEPGQLDALRCPSCGNASELDLQGRCSSCRNVVDRGDFGWQLSRVEDRLRTPQRPIDVKLGPGGDEAGVGSPTRLVPTLGADLRGLGARNPGFDLQAFRGRVRHVFIELQAAWSSMSWERARPYETDALFQSHRFWIERYRAQGLRNALDDVEVLDVVPCKAERDPWYETITVRVFARMRDYVVDGDGRVVGGNAKVARRFSEYWTFVKRSGVAEREPSAVSSCPSCAAPLDRVSQSGVCEYCGTKIVTGEFDWVLALIEQDEAYRG